jgi:hypothetical protein
LFRSAETVMPDTSTAELLDKINRLQAQITALSQQLTTGPRAAEAVNNEVESTVEASSVERPAVHSGQDHGQSVRTLRELLWQGRFGLAFHLARALETQWASGIDFHSASIRVWALAARTDRRSPREALSLVDSLLTEPSSQASTEESLPHRLFQWAALIALLGAVDPGDVRACAEKFRVPSDLPATAAWWSGYVESLASAPRTTTQWPQLPEHIEVAAEIEALMLDGHAEPIRLAASCLMMAIRRAMRHVRVVNMADERFILNSELARSSSVTFKANGEPSSDAATIERTVCGMALESPNGRAARVSEDPCMATAMEREQDSAADNLSLEFEIESVEPPTPRAQTAMSRLEAVEESLQTALDETGLKLTGTPATDDAARLVRREAARARLKRYAERMSSRVGGSNSNLLPFRTALIDERPSEPVVTAEVVRPLSSQPAGRNASSMILMPGSKKPGSSHGTASATATVELAEAPSSRLAAENLRSIHAGAVAMAFGAEPGRQPNWATPSAVRRDDRTSVWNVLFNAQSAILASLLVIAGAVIAGLGTGLNANLAMRPAAVSESAGTDSPNSEYTGDFEVAQ